MVKQLKLKCPVCRKEFISNRLAQIYCSHVCRGEQAAIRDQVKKNLLKQDMLANDKLTYNFNEDKFYFNVNAKN